MCPDGEDFRWGEAESFSGGSRSNSSDEEAGSHLVLHLVHCIEMCFLGCFQNHNKSISLFNLPFLSSLFSPLSASPGLWMCWCITASHWVYPDWGQTSTWLSLCLGWSRSRLDLSSCSFYPLVADSPKVDFLLLEGSPVCSCSLSLKVRWTLCIYSYRKINFVQIFFFPLYFEGFNNFHPSVCRSFQCPGCSCHGREVRYNSFLCCNLCVHCGDIPHCASVRMVF